MVRPPSAGRWTDRYGPRRNPVTGKQETHHGLDINATNGRVLVAPADCTITGYGVVPGWEAHGLVARLLDADGWEHWLSHTASLVPGRTVGDALTEGDPIALMGTTGQTTGLHVHWETRHNGARLDPETWLARPASGGAQPFDPDPDPDDEESDMFTLFQLDPTVDGRWVLVNYRDGSYWRLYNSYHLDRVRADPTTVELTGPQPLASVEGLRLLNPV